MKMPVYVLFIHSLEMFIFFQCFGELCGIAADLNGDALDSGCHLNNHLLLGIRKAHLHRADRLKNGYKNTPSDFSNGVATDYLILLHKSIVLSIISS